MGFADFPLPVIFVASVVVFLGASELGRGLGVVGTRQGQGNVSTIEASVLGLLALMLGFTFSLALSRFEERRDAVLVEANSIGTAALRARLLPAPHGSESITLLREYLQIRIDIAQGANSPPQIAAAVSRSNAIQEALWQHAMAAAAGNNGMVPTGLYIQSLNDVFDSQERRLIAALSTVPDIVLIALYCIAIIACTFAGYASGLESLRSRIPILTIVVVVSFVLLLVLDLDRPTAGLIRASQQPLLDTAATIASFADR